MTLLTDSPARPRKKILNYLQQQVSAIAGCLLPSPCLLCGGQNPDNNAIRLCDCCLNSLPRLGVHRCSCCSLPLVSPAPLCGDCLRKRPVFTGSAIPFTYAYPLDHLILDFKYRHQLSSGRCLSRLLLEHLQQQLVNGEMVKPDLLIPVPLHWWRQWKRGFNQAEWLARDLGTQLKIPVLKACQRTHQGQNQKGSGRRERQRNLRNIFTLIPALRSRVRGKHLAVVDDVVTTGATARVLSEILLSAGAQRVDIWALARTVST